MPRRLLQVLTLLLARQLLQPPGRLLEFLRDLTLQIAAATARLALTRRRQTTLPLGFLLLPARQLLQFFGELVELLVAALLLGALLQLVLIGELVHFELEQIGQIFGHLILAAATTAAAALRRDLDLVFLLGILQQFERPLLG